MMRWYNKSRRAQNPDDYETWIEGGVIPTMNGFDNGDIRTTTVILMRQREGKPGGGKGPLMSEDKSLTLATGNDQTLFVFHPHRSDGVRLQGKTVSTLTAYMGTGGLNTPMVATSEVRRLTPTECERLQGFPDGWTEGQSDTHRYKQLGNAVAVPVVDWLIRGITMID